MSKLNWQPGATLDTLRQRAIIIRAIRDFFYAHHVLEVETPLLCQHTVTDQHLHSFSIETRGKPYFLQTSPEYAMKRLLAAGSGSIFQINKAFRNDELGKQHNPEFTMLEFYRLDYDHHALMDEISELWSILIEVSGAQHLTKETTRISYQDLFMQHLNFDPLSQDLSVLQQLLKQHVPLSGSIDSIDYDTGLQLLLNHCIEPKLGFDQPTFVYDFPASQAALAKINGKVAERFEWYINGSEIANGFHELTDAKEQQQRFAKDNLQRQTNNLPQQDPDPFFLAALEHGLPECAGVAVGIDRLIMQLLKLDNISEVISFDWNRS